MRSVFHFEVDISNLVCKPVDDNTMKRSHHSMKRNHGKQPPGSSKKKINHNVDCDPYNTAGSTAGKPVKRFPVRQVFCKNGIYLLAMIIDLSIDMPRPPHHRK